MSLGTPAAAAGHHGNIAMMCAVSSSSVVVESAGAYYNTQTTGNHRHDLECVVCSVVRIVPMLALQQGTHYCTS